jgi:hypothetical protein
MRARLLIFVAICCFAGAGCGSSAGRDTTSQVTSSESGSMHVSGPVYFSVPDLRAASTAVVVANVGKRLSSQRNNGGNAGSAGIPMAIVRLNVERVLSGNVSNRGQLALLVLDNEAGISTDWSTFPKPGEQLVLFLHEVAPAEAPGLVFTEPTYNLVGGDNGVFSVTNGRAVSRAPVPVTLGKASPPTSISDKDHVVKLDVSVDELAAAVAQS